jgi:radical SAM superfamily enzyme YgiQ (UPF0313 family)
MNEDICLLFMPQCMPYDPYPALPYLKGYLKERNINVEQYDVNQDFYNYILKKHTLEKSYKLALKRFQELGKKGVLAGNEKVEYKELIKPVLFGENIVNSIEKAVSIMHDKIDFYDSKKYLWASNTISASLALYSSNFFPEKITLSGYQFCDKNISSLDDVINLVESDRISMFDEYFETHILKYIMKEKPEIIGFSMFDFSQFYSSLLLAKHIRTMKDYHPTILFGGILMSFNKDKFKKNPRIFQYIDVAMVYEGEEPLYQFIEYKKGKREIEKVNNIIFMNTNNEVIINNIGRFNINEISLPDYNGIAMDKYFSPEKVVSVISSKGCHWAKCTFCTQHLISGRGVYVERDLDKFINDIKKLKKIYGTRFFWINDTSIDPKRLEEISDRIIKENIDISWRCETRFENQLSNEIIRKLAQAGCKKIGFGMESASEEILKRIKKGITIKNVERILKTCFENGIAPQVYFIIGFPTETKQDVDKTLDFVEKNRKYMGTFGFSELFLEEGSEMQLYPQNNGIAEVHIKDELRRAYNFKSEGIEEKEAKEIVNEVVHFYAKEIGIRPFWGDEVESHHLFYLDYYNNPSLENAKINNTIIIASNDSYLQSKAKISNIEFDFELLEEEDEVFQQSIQVLLIDNYYRIFRIQNEIKYILDECSNIIKYDKLEEIIFKRYSIERNIIFKLVNKLIEMGAIELINE